MGRVSRGINAKGLDFEHSRAQFFREKLQQKANNEDTIIRTELQGIIVARVNDGIDKEAVVEELSSNPRYAKYEQFFGAWVDNVIRKNQIQKQKQTNQEKDK